MNERMNYRSVVKWWLMIGVFMIFMQVIIGGITRLTGSGLSITKWEIVTGALPPMNAAGWNHEFDLYKATPQYQKINEGMSMSDFKFIYFWEYFHRLWARSMGFIFAIPFFFFLAKGWIDKKLRNQLLVVVLLAALVASLGWIMVASGLVDRPWVNAYKLTLHLSVAFLTFGYLLWATFGTFGFEKNIIRNNQLKKWNVNLLILVSLQIVLGGIMSGMKAGLTYPTWPLIDNGFMPSILFNSANWTWNNFENYDSHPFMPALIQTLHRSVAYILTGVGFWYFFKMLKMNFSSLYNRSLYIWIAMLSLQVVLGILTLVNCIGVIPVGLGVFHQAGALFVLSSILFLNFISRREI